MSTHTPKSELKRRSYGPDKLEKTNQLLSRKLVATGNGVPTENGVATRNGVATGNGVATENLVAIKNAAETKKRPKSDILTKFQAHFTLGPYIYWFFR